MEARSSGVRCGLRKGRGQGQGAEGHACRGDMCVAVRATGMGVCVAPSLQLFGFFCAGVFLRNHVQSRIARQQRRALVTSLIQL